MQRILSKKNLQPVKFTGKNPLPSTLQVRLHSTKFN